MNKRQFHGTGVALITPFKNGEIDFDALERIIEYVIQGGVDYIVSLGTTGEAVNITTADCNKIFQFTRSTANERVPLVAGLFGCCCGRLHHIPSGAYSNKYIVWRIEELNAFDFQVTHTNRLSDLKRIDIHITGIWKMVS